MLEQFDHNLHGDVLTLRKIHLLARIAQRESIPAEASIGQIEHELLHHEDSDYFIGMGSGTDVAVVTHVSRNIKKSISVIEGIAVHETYRRRGIGTRALHELVDIERARGSTVLKAVPPERYVSFLAKAGFTIEGHGRHHVMTRHLDGSPNHS